MKFCIFGQVIRRGSKSENVSFFTTNWVFLTYQWGIQQWLETDRPFLLTYFWADNQRWIYHGCPPWRLRPRIVQTAFERFPYRYKMQLSYYRLRIYYWSGHIDWCSFEICCVICTYRLLIFWVRAATLPSSLDSLWAPLWRLVIDIISIFILKFVSILLLKLSCLF